MKNMEPSSKIQILPPKDLPQKDLPDEARDIIVDKARENWDRIVDSMVEKAVGLWEEQKVIDRNGVLVNAKVYQQPPDMVAAQYLINQVIGKPKENMVVQGKVIFNLDL